MSHQQIPLKVVSILLEEFELASARSVEDEDECIYKSTHNILTVNNFIMVNDENYTIDKEFLEKADL